MLYWLAEDLHSLLRNLNNPVFTTAIRTLLQVYNNVHTHIQMLHVYTVQLDKQCKLRRWRTRKCWTYNTIECSQRIIMTSIDSYPFSAADVSFAFSTKKSNKKDYMFAVEHDILVVCICYVLRWFYCTTKWNQTGI